MSEVVRNVDTYALSVDQAILMTSWLPDYLHGVIDQPGYLPHITVGRLKLLLGEGDPIKHMQVVRDSIMILEPEHQENLFSYFAGFPLQALDVVLSGETPLEESLICYQEYISQTKPVVERPTSADKTSSLISTMARRALSTKIHEPKIVRSQPPVQRFGSDSSEEPLDWMSDALCTQVDPEPFFPEKGGSTRSAKSICANCIVADKCLDYALQNDEKFGIWGGLSERERAKLKKART